MQYIKTTILGDVIFLIPFVIVIAVLGKAYRTLLLVAEPMSDWFPVKSVGGITLANVLSLAVC